MEYLGFSASASLPRSVHLCCSPVQTWKSDVSKRKREQDLSNGKNGNSDFTGRPGRRFVRAAQNRHVTCCCFGRNGRRERCARARARERVCVPLPGRFRPDTVMTVRRGVFAVTVARLRRAAPRARGGGNKRGRVVAPGHRLSTACATEYALDRSSRIWRNISREAGVER